MTARAKVASNIGVGLDTLDVRKSVRRLGAAIDKDIYEQIMTGKNKSRAPVPTEAASQIAVIDWFAHYAKTKGLDPRLLCASGNAAKRSYALAAALKRQGMRSGYPDLFLAVPRGSYHGLMVEMKRDNWTPPKSGNALDHHTNQCEIHVMLKSQGFRCIFCSGADAAINAIREYLE